MNGPHYPLFVKRDLDGFFGLLIDNLVQLLVIPALCGPLCGMTGADSRFIYAHILPGAAVSILAGNLFYAWQAHRLAKKTGRGDVTALPYGINTPSLLIYIFFVMQPVYHRTQSAAAAWQMGLVACLGSGLIELCGSLVAGWIRRRTPRAALLSTLAGIAIGFISMTFALQIFQRPLVAMLPLAIILITLFARTPFPLGIPGGLIAILAGTACAWLLPSEWTGVHVSSAGVTQAWSQRGLYLPHFAGLEIWHVFRDLPPAEWLGFLTVIVPMGLFNLIGSLQNIESAEAGGDNFDTTSSLAANGVGTLLAALFGSCFPTTIYIGHPGWKALGARAGYSTLNGVVITLICLTGTVSLISSIVPIEAGIAIVLWVGIIITAQAFQATPSAHAPAVAVGLFPAIAAWGLTVVQGTFILCNSVTLEHALSAADFPFKGQATEVNGFLLHGMLVIERGYIFTCMFLAAICALLVDRKFYSAMTWSLVAALFAAVGLTHAYFVQGNSVDFLFGVGWSEAMTPVAEAVATEASTPASSGGLRFYASGIAIGYVLFAALFGSFGWYQQKYGLPESAGHDTI